MNEETTQAVVRRADDELAGNVAMFFEADGMEAYAYNLLEGDSTSAVSWERFTEAKARADAKRADARQELTRIHGQLMNSACP